MRLGTVLLAVVLPDEALQPAIGLRLGLRSVKVVEGLVRFLNGPERALDLALGPRRRASPVFPRRQMRQDRDPEMLHHAAEHATLRDRPAVAVDRRRDTLKW
jgi:hypothetical protein